MKVLIYQCCVPAVVAKQQMKIDESFPKYEDYVPTYLMNSSEGRK
jgi:hypothetical protein